MSSFFAPVEHVTGELGAAFQYDTPGIAQQTQVGTAQEDIGKVHDRFVLCCPHHLGGDGIAPTGEQFGQIRSMTA